MNTQTQVSRDANYSYHRLFHSMLLGIYLLSGCHASLAKRKQTPLLPQIPDQGVRLTIREYIVDTQHLTNSGPSTGGVFDLKSFAMLNGISFPQGSTFLLGYPDRRVGMRNTVQNLDRFELVLKQKKVFLGYPGPRIMKGNVQLMTHTPAVVEQWNPDNCLACEMLSPGLTP